MLRIEDTSTDQLMDDLYNSEISAYIGWQWDGGMDWRVNVVPPYSTGSGFGFRKTVLAVCQAAIMEYPNSEFAKKYTAGKGKNKLKLKPLVKMFYKVEFLAGTDIEAAATSAIAYCQRLGVGVAFNFNGVEVYIGGDDTVEKVVESYQSWIDLEYRTRFSDSGTGWTYNDLPKSSVETGVTRLDWQL